MRFSLSVQQILTYLKKNKKISGDGWREKNINLTYPLLSVNWDWILLERWGEPNQGDWWYTFVYDMKEEEKLWYADTIDLQEALTTAGAHPDTLWKVFRIANDGHDHQDGWCGQKVNVCVRLLAWADTNAALTRIVSDKMEPGKEYRPSVVFWNNGRGDLPKATIEALILRGEDTLYRETKSLINIASDDSLVVEFPAWQVPFENATYKVEFFTGYLQGLLHDRFVLDECDEDDYLAKEFYVTGIEEKRRLTDGVSLKGNWLYYSKPSLLKVYDISGRIVLQKELKGQGRFDLDKHLGAEVYFINIGGRIFKWVKWE